MTLNFDKKGGSQYKKFLRLHLYDIIIITNGGEGLGLEQRLWLGLVVTLQGWLRHLKKKWSDQEVGVVIP